ncbi:hypothetical protein O6H91_15G059300 [Diphasiastrum complanatum]|nr:hypothetical protein O6H91_15G059300 [Diphasiastrum complanatum]
MSIDAPTELVGELSGVKLYRNGKVVRPTACPLFPKVLPNPNFVDGVATKDVVLDMEKLIWVRIYLPEVAKNSAASELSPPIAQKLPIMIFFHGGAFVIWSAATSIFDNACRKWASELGVIVVSVDYRLAPEHRLPAAYEDSSFALKWLQSQAACNIPDQSDSWLSLHGDFSSCFLMGLSSGGSIAHHVATEVCSSDLSPMRVRGIILVVPFFGGAMRTSSELRFAHDDILTLHDSDTAWEFSLPQEATRDHHYCNPLGPTSPDLKKFDLPPYLIIIGGKDPLHDRQMAFVEALRKSGKDVHLLRYENWGHYTPFPESELIAFMEKCRNKRISFLSGST